VTWQYRPIGWSSQTGVVAHNKEFNQIATDDKSNQRCFMAVASACPEVCSASSLRRSVDS